MQIKRKVDVKASYKPNKALLITTISNETFQAISAIVAILSISGLIHRFGTTCCVYLQGDWTWFRRRFYHV